MLSFERKIVFTQHFEFDRVLPVRLCYGNSSVAIVADSSELSKSLSRIISFRLAGLKFERYLTF